MIKQPLLCQENKLRWRNNAWSWTLLVFHYIIIFCLYTERWHINNRNEQVLFLQSYDQDTLSLKLIIYLCSSYLVSHIFPNNSSNCKVLFVCFLPCCFFWKTYLDYSCVLIIQYIVFATLTSKQVETAVAFHYMIAHCDIIMHWIFVIISLAKTTAERVPSTYHTIGEQMGLSVDWGWNYTCSRTHRSSSRLLFYFFTLLVHTTRAT